MQEMQITQVHIHPYYFSLVFVFLLHILKQKYLITAYMLRIMIVTTESRNSMTSRE